MRVRPWAMLASAGLMASGLVVAIAPASQAADCLAQPGFDVNHDGYEDLAVGVPNKAFGKGKHKATHAGAVIVMFGGADGFYGKHGSMMLSQKSLGGGSEKGDHYGYAVAVGDVNRDGCYDLVVGVPGENKGKGRVEVVYGSASGTFGAARQSISQESSGVSGASKTNDRFGSSVAIQQFPTSAALWIGVPGKDVDHLGGAGSVVRLSAGPAGGKIRTGSSKVFTQSTKGVPGAAQSGAQFGAVLSASRWSVLVGVPHKTLGSIKDSGAVYVYKSGDWSTLTQGNVKQGNEAGDRFGASVAQIPSCTGTEGDEAYVVGVPSEDTKNGKDVGRVMITDRPSGAPSLILEQGLGGMPGASQPQQNFGLRVASSGALVVMSAPNKDLGGARNAGAAVQARISCDAGAPVIAPGDADQISVDGPVKGTLRDGDRFGMALAFATSTAGADPMLIVGSPFAADGSVNDAGRATVFTTRSSVGGLFVKTDAATFAFGQSTAKVVGAPKVGDVLGSSLAGHA